MHSIFLSYSRRDATEVDAIARQLELGGYRVWLDRQGIRGGEQWRKSIVAAIEGAQVFVLLLSPNSVQSSNVRKELDLAEAAKIRILPVEMASTTLPAELKYQLAGVQLVNLWQDQRRGMIDIMRTLRDLRVSRSDEKSAPLSPQPAADQRKAGAAGANVDLSDLGSGGFLRSLFGRKR